MSELMYCPVCGNTWCYPNNEETLCESCKKHIMISTKITANQWTNIPTIKDREDARIKIFKKYVVNNPLFDRIEWDKRVERRNVQEQNQAFESNDDNIDILSTQTDNSQVHCPKCNSTQITAVKKGFGLGKAAIGGILTGGIGLAAGLIGSNKVKIVCLKCGHEWQPK